MSGAVFSAFGATARPWSSIVQHFRELAEQHPAFANLAAFAREIETSGFPEAGLCGLTSMHDLVLGPSMAVLDNPHLRIRYDFDAEQFHFEYQDGSRVPWRRTARPEEAFRLLERFLTKRARWFTPPPRARS